MATARLSTHCSRHRATVRWVHDILVVLFAAMCFVGRPQAATPVVQVNCDSKRDMSLAPIGPGPLELSKVYCQVVRQGLLSGASVSPDGRSIAYFEQAHPATLLHVAPLDVRDNWTNYQADMGGFAYFTSTIRSAAFRWASNSTGLWTATQERLRPSGFPASPLQPAMTGENGALQLLPPLRHDAGSLDALLWVDGDGLALAQFGTRGGSYQPQHPDPAPAFAIVDAKRGIVLDTLPFGAIETLKGLNSSPYYKVNNAAATKLQNGKTRALLSVSQWIVWTQGEPPRAFVDPYLGERQNRMTISRDGSKLLVSRPAQNDAFDCATRRRTSGAQSNCQSPPPIDAVIAALHDLETGQPIWTVSATVHYSTELPTPAISDDGRYALIGLPPAHARPLIALISMDDGKIVQTLPSPGGFYSMGFLRGGRTVWTHGGTTAFYDVRTGEP